MTITDAWIAVGIFIIIFEVLFLILHCIFSAEYRRNIKKIDELGKKSEEEFRFDKELEEKTEAGDEMCEYCDKAKALAIGETNDKGIALRFPNILFAYGYDVHGSGSNGIDVRINFCPMCGKELRKKRNKGM